MPYYRKRSYGRKIPSSRFDSASYAKGVKAGIAKAKGGWRPRRRY